MFMKIPNAYANRFFYHFTHADNIESIVKYGLLSTNEKNRQGITHENLANEEIQHRRSQMSVPINPNGTIHDYVPFYFATTNPILLHLLNRKNIDQPYIVYIAISIGKLVNDKVLFTDASANTSTPPSFFSNPQDLDRLKWNLIDETKWGRGTDDELHSRMAEVLIYKKVPIEWIDSYIVWNDICKERIIQVYTDNNLSYPNISYSPFNNRHFYYTKFSMKGRENETLVTGPMLLKCHFDDAVQNIIEYKKTTEAKQPAFEDIHDALKKIKEDFCIIEELEGIFKLQTTNSAHNQCVSDHTIGVVKKLKKNKYYDNLSKSDRRLVKLSAYLHDIGKGPKSKWENGIQPTYPDHPADAIPMITRILCEEFTSISAYEIRKLCLLVFYHDLIGDILERGRSRSELLNLQIDSNELNMLIAISLADASAINSDWGMQLNSKIRGFVREIIGEIM